VARKDQHFQAFKAVFRGKVEGKLSGAFETHYINFHGVFLYFVCGMQLALAECLAAVLAPLAPPLRAAHTVFTLLNVFLLLRLVGPLLRETTLSLLLA
jgi:hypothetical protein